MVVLVYHPGLYCSCSGRLTPWIYSRHGRERLASGRVSHKREAIDGLPNTGAHHLLPPDAVRAVGCHTPALLFVGSRIYVHGHIFWYVQHLLSAKAHALESNSNSQALLDVHIFLRHHAPAAQMAF